MGISQAAIWRAPNSKVYTGVNKHFRKKRLLLRLLHLKKFRNDWIFLISSWYCKSPLTNSLLESKAQTKSAVTRAARSSYRAINPSKEEKEEHQRQQKTMKTDYFADGLKWYHVNSTLAIGSSRSVNPEFSYAKAASSGSLLQRRQRPAPPPETTKPSSQTFSFTQEQMFWNVPGNPQISIPKKSLIPVNNHPLLWHLHLLSLWWPQSHQ